MFLLKNKKTRSVKVLTLTCSSHFLHHYRVLLALMTILAQSLLTLVGSHLVTLLFLSVWHNFNFFIDYKFSSLLVQSLYNYIWQMCHTFGINYNIQGWSRGLVVFHFALHAGGKALCWLKCRQVMCVNHDCCVF